MFQKKNDIIIFENGESLNLVSLSCHIPFVFIRVNPLHLEICEFIADNFYKYKSKSSEWKVLVNYLSQRSSKARIITALILLNQTRKISQIKIEFMGSEFSVYFNKKVVFYYKTSIAPYWIDYDQKTNSIIKYIPNLLFRFFSRKNFKKKGSVIRSWVDVDEKLHKTKFVESFIYIYPFSINLLRSIRFILHCFKSYKNVSLMGIPYSVNDLFNIVISKKFSQDQRIIKYEINAMQKHVKDFIGFSCIYTSDEYIPAIKCLYNNLNNGVTIINNTHGIGFYNPFIYYSKMIVFNDIQKNYYLRRNKQVSFSIKEKNEGHLFEKKSELILVYLDQGNLKNHDLYYEHQLQISVLSTINSISIEKNISPQIKFHPNRKNLEKKKIIKQYHSFNEIKKFDDQIIGNFIFVNLYSTAYYDFRKFGTFYFIHDSFFDPTLFFGDKINTINMESLPNFIESLFIGGFNESK